jgi:hypothetical protein
VSDVTALTAPAAGWYPDRNDADTVRWWDGQQWTDHTQSTTPAAAAFEQPVSATAFGSVSVSAPTPASAAVAPGWYPDRSDRATQRWWDGTQWTAHTTPTVVISTPTPGGYPVPYAPLAPW